MPAPKKNPVSSIAKKAVSKVRAGRAKKIEKKVDKFNDYMEYNRGTGLEYGYKKGKLVESEYGLPTGYSKKVKSRDLGKTFSSVKSPKKRAVKKSSMPIKKKK
ncbi:hypothetical protein EB001_25135 [bacterium]|nr:hypothetical protein [bacterium]